MRILGPPSTDRATALSNVKASAGVHARFIDDMFAALWYAGITCGVDPVGMIAQAFKETGGGQYKGKVRPEFYNTCGLKVRHLGLFPGVDDGDQPLAHQRFPNWTCGAIAHGQHLLAYAGVPVRALIVDPRYDLVTGQHLENFEDLGGKWAPDTAYGSSVVTIARRLQAHP